MGGGGPGRRARGGRWGGGAVREQCGSGGRRGGGGPGRAGKGGGGTRVGLIWLVTRGRGVGGVGQVRHWFQLLGSFKT